jgi:hypothetical protein
MAAPPAAHAAMTNARRASGALYWASSTLQHGASGSAPVETHSPHLIATTTAA